MTTEREQPDALSVDHLKTGLRKQSVRGGAATMLANWSTFVVSLGVTAVLGRTLEVADFGVVSAVTAFTGFITIFKDLGLSMATVQREDITEQQVSTLFWLNVLLGLLVCGVMCAASPLIAAFYDDPRLIPVTMWLSTAVIFGGLCVQHQALLRRRMRFAVLARVAVIAAILSGLVAIGMAVTGWGYWSLVGMTISAQAFTAVGTWLSVRWVPGLPRRGTGVRSMLAFGTNLSGAQTLTYFSYAADRMIIGRLWGTTSLGFYEKAFQLLMMPIRQFQAPLTAVAIPALSRLQNDPRRFRSYYMTALLPLAAIGMPVVAFSTAMAPELIRLALGPGWERAAVIFQFLAPAAFLQTVQAAPWIFIPLGRPHRQLRLAFFNSAINVVAFGIGAHWDAEGVALALSISLVLRRPFVILYTFHDTPLRFRDRITAIWRPAVSSISAGALVYALKMVWGFPGGFVGGLAIGGVIFGAAFGTMWLILPGGRKDIAIITQMMEDAGVPVPGVIRRLGRPATQEPEE